MQPADPTKVIMRVGYLKLILLGSLGSEICLTLPDLEWRVMIRGTDDCID